MLYFCHLCQHGKKSHYFNSEHYFSNGDIDNGHPSSKAWTVHFFDSLVDSMLSLRPGFGHANDDLWLASLSSSEGLTACCLPKDINLWFRDMVLT